MREIDFAWSLPCPTMGTDERAERTEEAMAEKLDTGAQFPTLTLKRSDGGSVTLPEGIDNDFAVVLFYRGHW